MLAAKRISFYVRGVCDGDILAECAMSGLPIKQLVHDVLLQVHEADQHQLIYCQDCQRPVTAENYRVQVQGEHQHHFVNPDGVVFELSCFQAAPGLIIAGKATDHYCWFQGFKWQYAHCEYCTTQLGWYYENALSESFFALISGYLRAGK
jgi:hypothetical protein